MGKISCILFDLDGVIVDTATYHYKAWKVTADALGYELTHKDNEALKGVSRVKSLEYILGLAGKTISDSEKKRLLVEKNELYLSYVADIDEKSILPGVTDLIDEAKEQGLKIGLGSASKNARMVLEKVGLTPRFDTIVDGTNVTKAKPDPEVFLIGAEQTDTIPSECLVIEDSLKGIVAAQTADMYTLGVGDADELGIADLVVESLEGISLNQLTHKIVHRDETVS